VRKLPKEYRLCCECLRLLHILVNNHLSYQDICLLIDVCDDIKGKNLADITNIFFLKWIPEIQSLLNHVQDKNFLIRKLRHYFVSF